MSTEAVPIIAHPVRVALHVLFDQKRWWLTCACRPVQGFSDRQEALQCAEQHRKEAAA